MVSELPAEKQQEILDEWVGQLRRSGKVANQLGYLGGIVRNAQAGTFVPTLAIDVKTAREKSARHAAEIERLRQKTPIQAVSSVASTCESAATGSKPKAEYERFKESMRKMNWRAQSE